MKFLWYALWMVFISHSIVFSNNSTVTIITSLYPPYVVMDSANNVKGVSCETAQEIFKAAGYQTNFKILTYPKAVEELFSNENAIMMGMFMGVPNYQSLNITEVLYTNFPTTYFYNSKHHPEYGKFTDINQTKNKTVSVMRGTGFYENIIKSSGGIITAVDEEEKVLQLILAGKTDFAHTGILGGAINIFMNPKYSHFRPVKFIVSELPSGLMFREGAYQIRDKFIEVVKNFKKNGELFKIYQNSLKNIPLVHPQSLLPDSIVVTENLASKK